MLVTLLFYETTKISDGKKVHDLNDKQVFHSNHFYRALKDTYLIRG